MTEERQAAIYSCIGLACQVERGAFYHANDALPPLYKDIKSELPTLYLQTNKTCMHDQIPVGQKAEIVSLKMASEGRHEIEAIKLRLSAARTQVSAATRNMQSAAGMMDDADAMMKSANGRQKQECG